jgi:hypothetical protein
MWIFWSTSAQLNRVANGKRVLLDCNKCAQKTKFYECSVDEGLKAYMVLDVWKKTKRVMQCSECLQVCDYYAVFPQEKAAAEKAEVERKAKAVEEERKQQQAAEQERLKQEQDYLQKKKEERARIDAQVDDELAQLKKKLGK